MKICRWGWSFLAGDGADLALTACPVRQRSGIGFFSLDAARLGAVVTARATYRLPYFWSRMRLDERDGEITYTCRRRWPDPQTATSRIHIRIGDPFTASDLNDRDHFLTARWV